jgi:replicative DNA helicase
MPDDTEGQEIPNEEPRPGRVPPYDLDAETALLGSMMMSRQAVRDALDVGVTRDDFYKPSNGRIYAAIEDLAEHGGAVDPLLITAALGSRDLDLVGGKQAILRIQAEVPASAHATRYARIVKDAAIKRTLIRLGGEISEMGYDETTGAFDALGRAQARLAAVDAPLGEPPDPNVEEWLSETSDLDWLVPGLLARQERVLIVATEGGGKTSLLRQIAIAMSAGLHPFRLTVLPEAFNVLLVDFENPETISRKKVAKMLANVTTLEMSMKGRFYDPVRLVPICRPEGIDLASPADERWLHDRIDTNAEAFPNKQFDLLCIGPTYQMDSEAEEKQAGARRVIKAINQIRVRHDCAVIMETHAPHEVFAKAASERALRPAGPRLWLRAPEFVMAIQGIQGQPAYADFYSVRPGRDERAWPKILRRGTAWPWVEEGEWTAKQETL